MSQFFRTFQYEDLPQGDVFRYLILQPGQLNSPLICDLRTGPIADTAFDALSYVWGRDERTEFIFCNAQTLSITLNLAEALRRVRSQDEPLTLWADGICINQRNAKDKSHQVMRMGLIYQVARRVLIYLGSDDDDHGSTLGTLLQDVYTLMQKGYDSVDMSWESLPYPDHEDHPLLDEERWESLYWLLNESWFSRGWVVQEAAVAQRGVVIWGDNHFDWEKLMWTCVWLSIRGQAIWNYVPFRDVEFDTHVMVFLYTHEDFARRFCGAYMFESSSPILSILNCARHLGLKDPRDRIYAFIALSDHKLDIVPDYTASHIQAYQDFAEYHIKTARSPVLLEYVSHDDISLVEGCSWVPRWDISKWSLSFTSSAHEVLLPRGLSVKPPSINSDTLIAHGVLLDTIHYVSNTFDTDMAIPQLVREVWEAISALPVKSPYLSTEEGKNSKGNVLLFLQSLCAGRSAGSNSEWRQDREVFALEAQLYNTAEVVDSPSNWLTTVHESQSVVVQDDEFVQTKESQTIDNTDTISSDNSSSSEEEDPNVYLAALMTRAHGRRFIVTNRGYMGLAPSVCDKDDTVAIIFGCQTPCILRRSPTLDSTERFIYLGATPLTGKKCFDDEIGDRIHCTILGEDASKDWVDWDVQEQDIYLI